MDWTATKLFCRGKNLRWLPDLLILSGIWLVGACCDRLWLALDQATPSWDAADYLTGSLSYWQALQTPQWFSGRWWTSLWLMSSKIPPLVYMSTTPIISLLGKEPDQIIGIFLGFSAILLGSVYGLGVLLLDRRVGLWAAGFCVLMPVLYEARLEYLLDYPLTAMVTLAFFALTLWRSQVPIDAVAPQPDGAGQPMEKVLRLGAEGVEPAAGHEPRGDDNRLIHPLQLNPQPLARLVQALALSARLATPHVRRSHPWLLAIAAGVSIGLALMTKQSAGLFLLVPLIWCGVEVVWQRAWWRVAQFAVLVLATIPVWLPWYRTNWLLILTSSKRATIDSAAIQGSPSLLTLDAWTFYLRYLPGMVSVPLFVVSGLSLLLFWRRSRVGSQWRGHGDYDPKSKEYRQQAFLASQRALIWLLVFLGGAYFLSTLNPNKDTRYFAPALPVLGVVLAYGMTLLPRSWRLVRWGSVSLASLLMLAALFPLFGHVNGTSPQSLHRFFPDRGAPYPHAQVIAEVRKTSPYLRSTIGVLPSTPQVNQHNVNFFGLVQYFQVYGRQVGTRQSDLTQDRRSLEWFLAKTGDQGSIRKPEIHAAMVKGVEQSGEFAIQRSWTLPDQSQLQLFHRRQPLVEVQQAAVEQPLMNGVPVQLAKIMVPAQIPPGQSVPVTYQWLGSWQNLQRGLVVLTWHRQGSQPTEGRDRWLHDHAIGLGMLFPEQPRQVSLDSQFVVTEQMAMLPPSTATSGAYRLEAVYLDRQTGQATPLPVPAVTVQISATATPTVAPELDLLTQLRSLAGTLPKGPQSLERISNEISRINQYDPVQDYLTQSQQVMQYRLQAEPKNRTYAYTLALATVLKRQVNDAIAALEQVTRLDATNPYAHAYLAFVNLYDFRAGAAQAALKTARELAPKSPEIQALSGIAALMHGHLLQAWQYAQAYQVGSK